MTESNVFKRLIILSIGLISLNSCAQSGIKYVLYSNGEPIIEIFPDDIIYYDTSQLRGYVEIHEIRLREDFYLLDSIKLTIPIALKCFIDGKEYFKAEHFHRTRAEPSLAVNFHFDPDCNNKWNFNEDESGGALRGYSFQLYTNNECNSIELFHRKERINSRLDAYYKKNQYFINYTDTARLAHEILLDPYYLESITRHGIPIK